MDVYSKRGPQRGLCYFTRSHILPIPSRTLLSPQTPSRTTARRTLSKKPPLATEASHRVVTARAEPAAPRSSVHPTGEAPVDFTFLGTGTGREEPGLAHIQPQRGQEQALVSASLVATW